jgi:hypothetical protein
MVLIYSSVRSAALGGRDKPHQLPMIKTTNKKAVSLQFTADSFGLLPKTLFSSFLKKRWI